MSGELPVNVQTISIRQKKSEEGERHTFLKDVFIKELAEGATSYILYSQSNLTRRKRITAATTLLNLVQL